jgi:hypothetical protein
MVVSKDEEFDLLLGGRVQLENSVVNVIFGIVESK